MAVDDEIVGSRIELDDSFMHDPTDRTVDIECDLNGGDSVFISLERISLDSLDDIT